MGTICPSQCPVTLGLLRVTAKVAHAGEIYGLEHKMAKRPGEGGQEGKEGKAGKKA